MLMKRKSLYICHLLLMLALIPVFSGCNTEDDLIRIFTGKTWKMSRITIEGKENEQFGAIVWDSEAAYNQSIELLKAENNFTVVFEGIEVNGELSGNNVTVNGVKVKNATGRLPKNSSKACKTYSNTRATRTKSPFIIKKVRQPV